MIEPSVLVILAATFFVAGTVKGVIGLGLPTIALALLSVTLGLTEAMALLLVPSFVTNFWQAMVGGNGLALVRRLWLFFLLAGSLVMLGAAALSLIEILWLSALLGGLLTVYGAASLIGLKFSLSPQQETWIGPLVGVVSGVLTGMTGSFVVPGVMFLQSLGLSRDALVQAMGILFTISTLALGAALFRHNLVNVELGGLSVVSLLPALIGMVTGQRIRKRLSEERFRRTFFWSLLILGVYIVVRAVVNG